MRRDQRRVRLDMALVERGLAESRELARRLIMAGQVVVDDHPVTKPGAQVRSDAAISLQSRPRYVSRGGEKLNAALERFGVSVWGKVCADVGASTGGFTDCLLQAGAARVYAIDVGYGQLAWSLRNDARVIIMERVNARYLEYLPEVVNFVSMDVSFISVQYLLANVRRWLAPDGQAVILIKPQFEAGRQDVSKGGVVRDPDVHRRVLGAVIAHAVSVGFNPRGLMPSPIHGPAGNIEFLLWLDSTPSPPMEVDIQALIHAAIAEAHPLGVDRGGRQPKS